MYKLFTDKTEIFECDIKLSGASLDKSDVRLVVESKDVNLLFKGKIDSSGKCSVPVKRLSGLLGESITGTLRLEVIADDTFFTPWESEFVVETSKKVTVEVKSQNKNRLIETKKPAIQVGLSVSRVWGSAQIKAMKKVSGTLKLDLAQYRELAAFSQFASDLDESTKLQLDRGERMMELLNQWVFAPVPAPKQVCALYAGGKGYLDQVPVDKILKFEDNLYASLDEEKTIIADIRKNSKMSEDSEKKLIEVIEKVVELNK